MKKRGGRGGKGLLQKHYTLGKKGKGEEGVEKKGREKKRSK